MKSVRIFLFSPFFPKDEYHNAYRFMGRYGLTYYPFRSSLEYKRFPVTVYRDEEEKLPYVLYKDKRMYFPGRLSEREIVEIYRVLLMEQSSGSAHLYINDPEELRGKTLLDIGTAEGIFSLGVIEEVNHAYLFECDEKWIEALQATFRPWAEKVEIVRKYVSDTNDDEFVSIDSFLKGKELENIYIKMDIEGMERSALEGAKELLTKGRNISMAICTYHHPDDAETIPSFLSSYGFAYEFTPGYLFIEKEMRKGVCKTVKSDSL